MNIILIGFTSCGKTTTGLALARVMHETFFDLDKEVEIVYQIRYSEKLSAREIFIKHGNSFFKSLENLALQKFIEKKDFILATGGGAPFFNNNKKIIQTLGKVVYLRPANTTIEKRMLQKGIPAYFKGKKPSHEELEKFIAKRSNIYSSICDITVDNTNKDPDKTANEILKKLKESEN